MKKIIVLIGISGIIFLGYLIFNSSIKDPIEKPVSNQQTTTETQNVVNVPITQAEVEEIKSVVTEGTQEDFSGLQMGETFAYKSYAFQVWYDDNLGGEALLRKDGDDWVLVNLGGGMWEDYSLIELGVPRDIAVEMVNMRPY